MTTPEQTQITPITVTITLDGYKHALGLFEDTLVGGLGHLSDPYRGVREMARTVTEIRAYIEQKDPDWLKEYDDRRDAFDAALRPEGWDWDRDQQAVYDVARN